MSLTRGVALAIEPGGEDYLHRADGNSLKRVAVRGGSILMGARLLVQVVTWLVTILVARFLMPYDYGVLTSGSIFLGLCDLLAEAGVGKALVQKRQLDDRDVAEGFTLSLMLAFALYVILLGLAGPAAVFFRNLDLAGYLRVAGLLILLVPFRSVSWALLERRLQMGAQASLHLLSALTQSALTLALAAAGWGFWSLLAGTMAARLLEVGILGRQAAWRPSLRWPRLREGSVIAFGLHISAASILWFVYSNADFAVVGRLVGPVALGFYSFAFALVSLPVQKLTSNINQIAYPVFCRLQHDPARLKDWYLRLITLIGLLGVPALAGMALVADDGIAVILGAKWTPAVLPFRLLSIAGILMIYGASLPPVLNALGRPDIPFRYSLASTLIYPLAFTIAGAMNGIVGVCLAWVVIYPLMYGLFVTLTRSMTGVGLAEIVRSQAAIIASTLLMIATVVLLKFTLGPMIPPPVRLLLEIVLGATTYGATVWLVAGGRVLGELKLILRQLRPA